ncbi:LamG domain-containing protein [Catenovulum sediminis]|uniref:LamG domain-containing protein n=1 Tax=Catenovulum sediminis TaxID=1740262 RepID=UPI00117C9445|nr:LamG domain-containing protein [Catenovulum sediminis]
MGVKLDNINAQGQIPVQGEYALNFKGSTQAATWRLAQSQQEKLASEFTFSIWLNLTQSAQNSEIIAASNQIKLVREGNKVALYLSSQESPLILTERTLTLEEWHNLSVIYSDNHLNLLLNGELQKRVEVGTVTISEWSLGKSNSDGQSVSSLTGAIDHLQLWSRALSTEQLQQLSKAKLTGMEPHLILAENFNQSLYTQTSGLLLSNAQLADFTANDLSDGLAFANINLNQAYYFDSVDDALTSDALNLDLQQGITLDFYNRFAKLGQNATLISHANESRQIAIKVTDADQLVCTLDNLSAATPANALDLLWHHWACTFSVNDEQNLVIQIYKDGALLNQQSFADFNSYDVTANLILGKNNEQHYSGWMDEFHVWNRVLPVGDLIALQNAAPSHNSLGLTARWHFNDVFAGTYTDVINGNNAVSGENSASTAAQGITFKNAEIELGTTLPTGELKTGLWQGRVVVSKVNESHIEVKDSQALTEAGSTFLLPFLLHASADRTHILSEVTLMQTKPGVDAVRPVLITDQRLLANYDGIVRKNGKLVGVRLSAIPFILDSETNAGAVKVKTQQVMQGKIGEGGAVSVILTYAKDHPLNPYKHLYHPDLDKGFEIKRHIHFMFDEYSQAQKSENPRLGVDELSGVYTEKVTGLHQQTNNDELAPIISKGRFSMQLVSSVKQLNAVGVE